MSSNTIRLRGRIEDRLNRMTQILSERYGVQTASRILDLVVEIWDRVMCGCDFLTEMAGDYIVLFSGNITKEACEKAKAIAGPSKILCTPTEVRLLI